MGPQDWPSVTQLIASQQWLAANRVGAAALRAYMEKQRG